MSIKYTTKKVLRPVGPVTREDLNKLPNRFWLLWNNGWYSVARNSPAHMAFLGDQVRQPLKKEWWP